MNVQNRGLGLEDRLAVVAARDDVIKPPPISILGFRGISAIRYPGGSPQVNKVNKVKPDPSFFLPEFSQSPDLKQN